MGKRLRPLTFDIPKPLVKVGGKPIILHQLEAMNETKKIDDIILILGYKCSMVRDLLLEHEICHKITIVENQDYENTNNLFSLYLSFKIVKEKLSSKKYDNIIIINGDILFDKSILDDMLQSNANKIAVDVGTYYDESMKVIQDSFGRIKKISKDITESEALGVSIDLYQFDLKTWRDFISITSDMIEKENMKNVWTEHALQKLFDVSRCIFAPLDVKGRFWYEVDTYKDLKEAIRRFYLNQNARKILNRKLYIFDLDGTILIGDTLLPHVIDFINSLLTEGKRFVFLTNNSSISELEHLERLRNLLHIELDKENIYSSVNDTISYLKKHKIKKVFLLATPSVVKEFKEKGIITDSNNPDAVIVTFDKTLTYEKIRKASVLLCNEEIKFILTNCDMRCPTEKGYIPDAGSIAKLLEETTKKKIDVSRGKPNPEMINNIIAKHGLSKTNCVFFGDRLYTDIVMGDKSGVMTVLMLTGETSLDDLDIKFLENHVILNNFKEVLLYSTGVL